MGGLLAAKVLADFYETVTVVERDVLVAVLGNPRLAARSGTSTTLRASSMAPSMSPSRAFSCAIWMSSIARIVNENRPVQGCFAGFREQIEPANCTENRTTIKLHAAVCDWRIRQPST
jgi:hypothetical protein